MGHVLNWVSISKPFEGVTTNARPVANTIPFMIVSYYIALRHGSQLEQLEHMTKWVYTRDRREHIGSNRFGEFINPAHQYSGSKIQKCVNKETRNNNQ